MSVKGLEEALQRIENLNAALVQITNHVGACCGGVDVLSKTGNYSDTAESIIKRIDELNSENFTLAAGCCCVDGGLVGDDGGTPYCTLKARIDRGIRIKAHAEKPPFYNAIYILNNEHANATLILDEDIEL